MARIFPFRMAEAVLCAVCRVGAGLRPRPVFRGRGIRRGRPMCRPGHGSVAGPIHGRTHRSAPTRGGERSGTNGNRCRNGPRQRGGTEPAPYRRRSRPARPGRRGKGYGSNAGSAQQRADVPKAWLPPTKFRAEIWGVSHGHRPLRPAGDEGRHAGSSCPTGGCGEPPRLPWVAAHSGASAARVRRNGRESRQRSSPKCPATPDNPSVALRATAPFAQGSLWGRGYGLPRRFAPRNDSSDPLSFRGGPTGRRGNPFPFTMDGGSGCRT